MKDSSLAAKMTALLVVHHRIPDAIVLELMKLYQGLMMSGLQKHQLDRMNFLEKNYVERPVKIK
jgi:hypothetical protein